MFRLRVEAEEVEIPLSQMRREDGKRGGERKLGSTYRQPALGAGVRGREILWGWANFRPLEETVPRSISLPES